MRSVPQRPVIPAIAWFAVTMWCGAVLGEHLSWVVWSGGGAHSAFLVIVCFVVAVCAWALAGRSSVRAVLALLVAGALAGVVASTLAGTAWRRLGYLASDAGARVWYGTVEADPVEGAFGTTVRVRIRAGPLDGARVRVGWPASAAVPALGRTVRFSAILKSLPSEELWARRVARSGVCATGRAWRAETGTWRPGPVGLLLAWRESVLEGVRRIPGPGGALAEGIVLGDRRRLIGTATEEDFRTLGLSHLVAVSGSHLALACGAVAVVLRALKIPRRPLVVVTVLTGAAYAVVTGMPYSALRSVWMLAVGGAGQLAGRRSDGLASLALAIIAVLAFDPWAAFDVGFQLSAVAVAGLLLFGGLASAWMDTATGSRLRPVTGALALTGVAQAATVTISASTFGMVSVLAPLANAVASPMVTVALWVGLGGAVGGTVAPHLGDGAMRVAASVLAGTAWVAAGLSRLPGAAVVMGAGSGLAASVAVIAAGLWMWWPLPASRKAAVWLVGAVVVGSAVAGLGPRPVRAASIAVLDVGQGDAILVRDAGRAMLVDTGADATVLRRALARYGIRRADVVVLTHAHDDHTGGAPGLASVLDMGWVGVPAVVGERGQAMAEPIGHDLTVRPLATGDQWLVGRTRVSVLWPPATTTHELGTNDTSVVLALSREGFDAVLTGDAEEAAQRGMETHGGLSAVEVLKVPHHGSVNGLTERGARLWRPQASLISVGAGNDFGHPAPETLELLMQIGSQVWRTDLSGDLVVHIGRKGYRIAAARSAETVATRATIPREGNACGVRSPGPHLGGEESRGDHRYRRPQAGLSDLWERRPPARARPPPAS